MRLKKLQCTDSENNESIDFNNWILNVGNGSSSISETDIDDDDEDCTIVEIPSDLLITTTDA